jgi:RNA polymerase sigma-70 factor (ECF subfamily)
LLREKQTNESRVNPLNPLLEERLHPQPSPPQASLNDVDREKVAAWASKHWDAVFAMLYRLCTNRHQAEDLTQETFLRAGRQHATFQSGTNLRAWLMRIAVNAHLDLRRRDQATRVRQMDYPSLSHSPASDPHEHLAGRELANALDAALAKIPETARIVFVLRTRQDMSFAEIAGAIETTEATARWHMLQARRQLLERLKDFSDQ